MTLCSIVQKEALSKSSQGNIASTLEKPAGQGHEDRVRCDLLLRQALRDHGFSQSVYDAYYTYRCPGLPAGPIANPGTEIMTATVEHPSTDYLYFFSDLKGNFHFAATYGEFESLRPSIPGNNGLLAIITKERSKSLEKVPKAFSLTAKLKIW